MSDSEQSDDMQAIVDSVARGWAAQWSPEHLFIGRGERGRDGARAVVTVALGGPARERVSRLVIDLRERRVCTVAPVEPMSLWKGDPPEPTVLAWTARCWPEVERVAASRGVRAPACTAMAIRGRWWAIGPRTLWLCVEDLALPNWAHRDEVLRFSQSGRLVSEESGLWSGMKGARGGRG